MVCAFALLPLLLASGCGKSGRATALHQKQQTLSAARNGFLTKLIRTESQGDVPATPPENVFDLIRYPSPAGKLAAYLSPDPGDGQKHPIVIWLTGGFSNGISGLAWERNVPAENDLSAAAYRKAGLPMMYPSLRGGNDNPGVKEGLFGEVNDVLAAANYAASLPWVDPSRIYLGGHSTGGTLALLTAEAAAEGRFRAVITFGAVEETSAYGQQQLPFDITDAKECELRAPIGFLKAITCPTFVLEGEEGNSDSWAALRKSNRNKNITFIKVSGKDHFSILHPANALLASKILNDRGKECEIEVTEAEIQAASIKAKDANFQPTGDLRSKTSYLGAVFYYTPEPAVSPVDALGQAVDKSMKGVPIVSDFKDAPTPPFIVLTEEAAPLKDYPVPDGDSLKYYARGMSASDIKAVQGAKRASIMVLVNPANQAWKNAKAFNLLVDDFARRTNAFIWDSATRECFHQDAWKAKRIDDWGNGDLPDLRSQITIHLYPRNDGSGRLRAITLGMEKFALPDVAIEQLTSSDNRSAGNLINVFCQTIAMNPVIDDSENFPISLGKLEPSSIRESYQSTLLDKGTGQAVITIMAGTPDDGDSENAQVSLDFRHGEGITDDERRSSLLGRFWGSKDAVLNVKHDDQIEKASNEAKLKLLTFKEKFRRGLEPGSRLMVKAPFVRDDTGNEWMWVEVLKWEDNDTLSGLLQNDPFYIKKLKAGAQTSIKATEIFDYILYHPDGGMEGNTTGKLIEENAAKQKESTR